MSVTLRSLALWALVLSFLLSFGCGGCDETGGTTIDLPDIGSPADVDEFDVNDGLDALDALDTDTASEDTGPVDGEACDEDQEGVMRPCGSSVGECVAGSQYCINGFWGECIGGIGPQAESCNGRDDNCSGTPDDEPDLCPESVCHGAAQCVDGDCVYDPSTALDCSHLDTPCMMGLCIDKDGECIQVPREDGTACNDGNLCTVDEGVCSFGECIAEAKDCSGAGDQCNEGICDPATGACVAEPLSDGTVCDDDLFCTINTTCQAGQCVGQGRSCAESADQCNDAACSEELGCHAVPLTGNACSDGLYCTINDTCQEGICVGGAPRDCSAQGGSCRTGTCDEATQSCTGDPVPDGTLCDDGLYCTIQTACIAGECSDVRQSRDCSSAGDGVCTTGTCNEDGSRCDAVPVANGTLCDDGRFCTTNTTCNNGACLGEPVSCDTFADACNAGRCSEAQGGCYADPRPNGTLCDDGLACTVSTTCTDGACLGEPRSCAHLNTECTLGICDESAGGCATENRPDGTLCDDGRFCSTESSCLTGACTNVIATRDCADFNDSCHVGQCNLETDRCERVQTVFPCMTVTITGAPEARTWSTEALFEFECSEPVCEYECRVDGGSWMPCESPQEYIGFTLGEHTFEVRARKNGGEWTDPDRHIWEIYLPTCADAAASRLYIGCEYWPVVLHNAIEPTFHDHFAVVVTNPLPGTTAQVEVFSADSATPIAGAQVPGNELRVIRLPWNAMAAIIGLPGGGTAPRTQQGTTAYRLTSDIPVNAYQFNPLLSYDRILCTGNGDCPGPERCAADGRCQTTGEYSYSNDASLLLPAHTFGTNSQYMVPALPHMRLGGVDYPSYMAIVATQDNTQVRIRNRGYIAAGPTFTAMDPSGDRTITLNRHEVLQVATRAAGVQHQATAVPSNYGTAYEYPDSDLTGTIVSANKPIGLYSGASCRMMPFNYLACDHLEQQIFPLETLGHAYVGAVAVPPAGADPATSPVKGDVWRLVAVQNGTQVTVTPASVHGPVTLDAGEWIEFTSDQHFYVESQGSTHPILLSQYLVSQRAHGGTQGDPSMILAAPVGQYRQQSIFTTPSEIDTHYVNIVRRAGMSVNLDGEPVAPTCWQTVTGTNFEVCRMQISEGVHTVSAANGVGLTIYGYDSYVSYGYTGGLGLLPTTAINPDW